MLLCAQYVVPITADPIEDGAVLVRDGKIVDVGPAAMLRSHFPDEEVKDFGTAAIMPGFIDLYSCSEDAALRGLVPDVPYARWLKVIWDLRNQLSNDEIYASSVVGGIDAIAAGITTSADITKSGAAVRAAQELGYRSVVYREVNAVEKDLVGYAIHKADKDIKKWGDMIDRDRIQLGLAPAQAFRCHPSLYTAVTEYANGHGDLPIMLRLAGSREEYRFVKYGTNINADEYRGVENYMEVAPWLPSSVTPVNYVLNWGALNAKNVLAVHCVKVKDADIDTLRTHDVAVAICPTVNAQLGMGAAPLQEFIRSGLRIGISTNAPAALDFVDMFTEMRVALLMQRAVNAGSQDFLSSQTVLEMGTIRAAQALHLDDKIGSLEVGKCADIVAVDLSHSRQVPTNNPVTALLSSAGSSDVTMTMVNGNILYERGKPSGISKETARCVSQVLEVRSRLRSKLS